MKKSVNKNYWDQRKSSSGFFAYFRDKLINSIFFPIIAFIFSTRISDQKFLEESLLDSNSVLDVACGAGKKILASKPFTAGVDISGYPKELAINNGYDELCVYDPPTYEFTLSKKVDAITVVNLNAHISFDAFLSILKSSSKHLKAGGKIVMINEYDNNGLSYRIFHQNQKKLDSLVNGMEHFFFEYENQFLEKLNQNIRLSLVARKPLIGSFLPCMHYSAYFFRHSNYKFWKIPSLFVDAIFGVMNSIQCRLFKLDNKSFLVGYEFKCDEPFQ